MVDIHLHRTLYLKALKSVTQTLITQADGLLFHLLGQHWKTLSIYLASSLMLFFIYLLLYIF